jgi:cytochrome c oxidase subunit 2
MAGGCGENHSPASDQPPRASARSAGVTPLPGGEKLESLHIEITGHDYRWSARYPGADGLLGTADDVLTGREVHVPLHAKTQIDLKSGDFIYTFALPHWGLKEIAVPDMTFTLNLTADRVGSFQLLGDQMCGYAHPDLLGTLTVQTQDDFAAWLGSKRRGS